MPGSSCASRPALNAGSSTLWALRQFGSEVSEVNNPRLDGPFTEDNNNPKPSILLEPGFVAQLVDGFMPRTR